MINKAMFTSKTDLWATPQDLFDKLDATFHFTLDACALPENAKCAKYFTPEQNALEQTWEGTVFMNPPYGADIAKWVRKAFDESQKGARVVCLLPARTDTKWWHKFCTQGHVWYIKGRIKFGGSKNSAPFPSAIVVFDRLITIMQQGIDGVKHA